MHIIDLLRPHLEPTTQRSHAIDATTQVFVALRFYATGCFYTSSSAHHGVSEASVCRIVNRVTDVLMDIKDDHIKWPTADRDRDQIQWDFFLESGFPGAIGAIDCTHVRLDGARLGDNEHVYVNRKGEKTINVQLICTRKFVITNVVAKWPGSTHDSRILQNSGVGQMYERGQLQGLLIGDSGYPQRNWLMTPFRNPTTDAQRSYNE